jgi:hypothetical protein
MASGSKRAHSMGAGTRFSTEPRRTTWPGGGNGGETAAAASGKTTGASTGASARDSPAPVAAEPPAPAAEVAQGNGGAASGPTGGAQYGGSAKSARELAPAMRQERAENVPVALSIPWSQRTYSSVAFNSTARWRSRRAEVGRQRP